MPVIADIFKVFEECEGISSRNAKLDLLEKVKSKSKQHRECLKDVFDATMNMYRRYGIQVSGVESSKRNKLENGQDLKIFEEFKILLFKLESREITGNVAREKVNDFLRSVPSLYNDWFTRIINKDLENGVATGTVDVLYPNLLPTFGIQLAVDAEKVKNLNIKNWLISQKMDGCRGLAFPSGGTILSRGGRELYNVQVVLDELQKYPDYVFDGELLVDGKWTATASVVRASKSVRDADKLRFHVFDVIPLAEFRQGRCSKVQSQRLEELEDLLGGKKFKHVQLVSHVRVKDYEHAKQEAKRYITDLGFEGAVVKNPNGIYSFARTKDWLKIKSQVDEDVRVLSVKEGTGRLVGTLGSLEVRAEDGRTWSVGTKLSDEDRVSLWKLHKKGKLVGRTIEVRYELAPGIVGRFPRFVRLRDDK